MNDQRLGNHIIDFFVTVMIGMSFQVVIDAIVGEKSVMELSPIILCYVVLFSMNSLRYLFGNIVIAQRIDYAGKPVKWFANVSVIITEMLIIVLLAQSVKQGYLLFFTVKITFFHLLLFLYIIDSNWISLCNSGKQHKETKIGKLMSKWLKFNIILSIMIIVLGAAFYCDRSGYCKKFIIVLLTATTFVISIKELIHDSKVIVGEYNRSNTPNSERT